MIADLERGRFSVLGFYERRARRILSALFLVMAACVPFAVSWMFPLELNDFFQSIFATTLFSSNILFWLESGYFSLDAELKPLLHTWRLAIEEQYYIFFPLLLMLVWRGANRVFVTVFCFGLMTLASFVLAVMGANNWPDANFYLLPMRAWELLAGALCAVALSRGKVTPHGGLSALGIALIAAGLIWSTATAWPSWTTLLPVVGSSLVILFARPTQIAGRVLASAPMVGVGLISYSAYLWHQPILAFARLRLPEAPGPWLGLLLVALTFGLAYLT